MVDKNTDTVISAQRLSFLKEPKWIFCLLVSQRGASDFGRVASDVPTEMKLRSCWSRPEELSCVFVQSER